MQCSKTKWESWYQEGKIQFVAEPTEEQIINAYFSTVYNMDIQDIKKTDTEQEACSKCDICNKNYYFLIKVDKKYLGKLVSMKWKRIQKEEEAEIGGETDLGTEETISKLRAKVAELSSYEYYDRDIGFVQKKADIIMIVFPVKLDTERKYNFNHVSLDNKNKKALAYCQEDNYRSGKQRCTSMPQKVYFEVDYNSYVPKDFFGHLNSAKNIKQIDGKTCEKSKQCDLYEYNKDNQRYVMYVRQANGIP